jgi:hypothetical protein
MFRPGGRRRGAAPGEPRVVQTGFDFIHASGRRALVDDTRPFRYYVEHQGALALVHLRGLQSLRLDRLTVFSRTEHQAGQFGAQNRFLSLILVERVQQGKSFVTSKSGCANHPRETAPAQ